MLTRRKFFNQFLIGASAVASIGCADALFLEPKNLVSEHLDIRLTRLPEEFHGFRIAQISDIHFGPYMEKGDWSGRCSWRSLFGPIYWL